MTGPTSEWGEETRRTINKLTAVHRRLSSRYVRRDRAISLLELALLCREHVLLLGPPGTAKTDLVMRFADLVNARKFSYLLTRFTEPTEVFGSLDYNAFRNNEYRVNTHGMLPWAHVAFLDEIFQGSSAILNSLLTLINERVFHNGSRPVRVPLLTMVGAANDLPDDPVLRAFADRMLLRIELTPVAGSDLERLITAGWEQERESLQSDVPLLDRDGEPPPQPRENAILGVEEIVDLSRRLPEVDLTDVFTEYTDVIRELLAAKVTLSDRRVVRGRKLIAGAALLRGAVRAEVQDFWPLVHFWTDRADLSAFEEIVQSRVLAHGGAPLHPVASVRQLLADATFEFDRAQERLAHGPMPPSVLERTLSRLQEILLDLRRYHDDTHAAAQVIAMRDQMMAAFAP